jgi:hypothetical protein
MVISRKPRRKSYREYDLRMPGPKEEVPVLRLIYILTSIVDPIRFKDHDRKVNAKAIHAVHAQVSSIAYKKEKVFGEKFYDGDHMILPIDFFTWALKQNKWNKALLEFNQPLPCYKDAGGSLKGEGNLEETVPTDRDALEIAYGRCQRRLAKQARQLKTRRAVIAELIKQLRKKRKISAELSRYGESGGRPKIN